MKYVHKKIITQTLFWGIVLFCFLNITPPSFAQTSGSIIQDFRVEVGEEQYVLGPTDEGLDNPFFTVPISSGFRAFTANGNTISYTGSTLNQLRREGVAIDKGPGPGENFDECGAWLHSIHKIDENHWVGWYHAEEECNYSIGVSHWSVGYAESFDAGKTWTKPGYPNNKVISSEFPLDGSDLDDAAYPKVIRSGEYFYMFFIHNWKIYVARSTVTDLGKPGTWFKYYNGQFNEPGLGGKSSPLDPLARTYVSYNTYLGKYISAYMFGKWGFYFYYSNPGDLLRWNLVPETIYPAVSQPGDARVDYWHLTGREDKLSVYAYTSIIGINGDSDVSGQSFYIYYMKIFPGEDFYQRYLMRRMITLRKRESPYAAMAKLTEYKSGTRTKISTEIAPPGEGYVKERDLGFILTYPRTGFIPLYECKSSTGIYSLTTTQPTNWLYCGSSQNAFVRRVGWISPTNTSDTPTALSNLGYIFAESFPTTIAPPTVSCTTEGTTSQMSVNWATVTGATFYNVMIDTTQVGGNISGTTHTQTGLAPGSSHTAQVRSCNGTTCSLYSNSSASALCPLATTVTPLAGDLNNDRIVDVSDWEIMRGNWGVGSSVSDINSDGVVNSIDFAYLNKNWLRTN